MQIIYDSLTGNVARFTEKIKNYQCFHVNEKQVMEEPFVLITYTTGFGEIPKSTASFLEKNYSQLQAVAVSGNRAWGTNYGKAGHLIANSYHVPLLHTFELSGHPSDVETLMTRIKFLEKKKTI